MKVKYATGRSVVTTPDGAQVLILKGTHWPADDPVVQAHPGLFSDDPRYGLMFTTTPEGFDAPVEQATAAPGERRQTRRG